MKSSSTLLLLLLVLGGTSLLTGILVRVASDPPIPVLLLAGLLATLLLVAATVLVVRRRAREESEAELADARRRIEAILDSFSDGVITLRPEGTVDSFHRGAEEVFGYPAGEMAGRPFAELVPEAGRQAFEDELMARLRGEESRFGQPGVEIRAQRRDGSVFPAELTVTSFQTEHDTFHTAVVRDISERKRLETNLRRSQRLEAVGQLTDGVTHDFNNLLTVILGNLQLLERRLEDEEARSMLSDAQRAAWRGSALSRKLLAFSRREPLESELVDVNEAVVEIESLLRRTLEESISLEVKLGLRLPALRIDRGQLDTALLNLALNGRDAMAEGGTLTLRTSLVHLDEEYAAQHPEVKPGRHVRVEVRDTGTGMAPEVLEKAYEPFFTTKEIGKGSGLGLSIVYGFVRQSGGHIILESERGRGTSVQLLLPAASGVETGAGQVAEIPESAAPHGARDPNGRRDESGGIEARGRIAACGEPGTVLVVEDDAGLRASVLELLEGLGLQTLEARSGNAALEVLEAHPEVSVLFTDMIMPGEMDGLSLAREARRRRPGLKLILSSGAVEREAMGETPRDVHIVPKPYRRRDLEEVVQGLLAGRAG